jgi:hypothetical protein
MIQRRKYLRLAFEASHASRIAKRRIQQYLDCHIAIQSTVASAVNLSHAANA